MKGGGTSGTLENDEGENSHSQPRGQTTRTTVALQVRRVTQREIQPSRAWKSSGAANPEGYSLQTCSWGRVLVSPRPPAFLASSCLEWRASVLAVASGSYEEELLSGHLLGHPTFWTPKTDPVLLSVHPISAPSPEAIGFSANYDVMQTSFSSCRSAACSKILFCLQQAGMVVAFCHVWRTH